MLSALADSLAANVSRLEKKLAPRLYWRALADAHPIDGIAPETLDAALEALARSTRRPDPGPIELPRLTVRGARAYYDGQPIEKVPPRGVDHAERGWRLERRVLPEPGEARSVVFSPHHDDAALSLGGTLVARRPMERPAVINVFTTSSWLGTGFRARTLAHVTELRRAEEALASELLGYTHLGLGLWEVDIRTFYRAHVERGGSDKVQRFGMHLDLRTEAERDAVVRAMVRAARTLLPARMYFPLAVGAHADHVALRELALIAIPSIREVAPDAEIVFFEDLYYAIRAKPAVSAPAIVEELGARGFPLELVLSDVTGSFALKQDAVAAHRSQFSREEVGPALHEHAARAGAELGPHHLAERTYRLISR